MQKEALASLFYKELEKIIRHTHWDTAAKIHASYRLMGLLFTEITRDERLFFSTLFARMSYVGHRYHLDRQLQYYLHVFRRKAGGANPAQDEHTAQAGYKALADTILAIWGQIPHAELAALLPLHWPLPFTPSRTQSQRIKARVVVLADDAEQHQFIARDEAFPEEDIRIQYQIADRNDNFELSIRAIRTVFGFPVTVNLLDIDIDDGGIYRPRAFVVEPDYLVDVSAVAECFRDGQPDPWSYLLKRYLPFTPSISLVIGNIANFFLDELMTRPEVTFEELKPRIFQTNPLIFCLFNDHEVREIMQGIQTHYLTLRTMIAGGFAQQGIQTEHCYLEPSFFSETYGLQGRLDVFYRNADQEEEQSAIIELKSGKPFMPNTYGIGATHYIQTLLYDLLIRSAFGAALNPTCFILYSGQTDKPLRFAPVVRAQQYEALQARNQLVAIEWLLARLGSTTDSDLLEEGLRIFNKLNPVGAKGFTQRDLAFFADIFQKLSPLEKKYFIAFSGFIAREHQRSKTGVQGIDNLNGMAALWRNRLEEKQENFEILNHLEVLEVKARELDPVVSFRRSTDTNPLANFRKGDIAVLYPTSEDVLSNQIFKCTIVEIGGEQVKVRLRSPQFNDAIFKEENSWNLEHDLLDSSFVSQYRGLMEWAAAPLEKRQLLLGQKAPQVAVPMEIDGEPGLTDEQREILGRALAAPDYFLLWGPPGTGKTSVMLRSMARWLLEHTNENILLLAYTNRAVDEICAAIESVGEHIRDTYFRIGSRYATEEQFHAQLLEVKIRGISSRQELKNIIDRHRIVVATVASIASKPELMQLKSFQRVIIDEASQILEPMLTGLLPRFQRFILIGDHKQLPAVVAQPAEISAVADESLNELGLYNLRNSLFERLFKQCQHQGWHSVYAQLSRQGRMHRDIMAFPNQFFYNNLLDTLPESTVVHQRQQMPISLQTDGSADKLEQLICQSRAIFLHTPVDDKSASQKTNRYEAELIADLIQRFQRLYAIAGKTFSDQSVGVITPYRAQIAMIRQVLEERGLDTGPITIDTVERYQGGARDIILLSLCTNRLNQITSLVSLSDEGVDRRLNVALTRAREYVVVLGNAEILSQSQLYNQLMQQFHGWT